MVKRINNIRFVLLTVILILIPRFLHSQNINDIPVFFDMEQLDTYSNIYLNNVSNENKIKATIDSISNFLLNAKPLSVMDKSVIPPSGDKHDFMSIGPYWWPDSSKPNGLPYIRRDGERNPQYFDIPDERYLTETIVTVEKLASLNYITKDSKYADKAEELLQVWFINEDTKMNPNLLYSQGIPGITTGRGIGIIESRLIFKITDAIILLRKSNHWNQKLDEDLTSWFNEYYTWLKTHQYGIDESNEKNNHGTWYDVQTAAIAIFLNKYDDAKEIINDVILKRIEVQIDDEGKQPLELARTKSWSYSLMNLSAFFHLAIIGDVVGVDLWNSSAPSGGSIKKALDYLLPFALDHSNWQYKQIEKFKLEILFPMLQIAQNKYDEKYYGEWITQIFGEHVSKFEAIKKL